jgi:GxxExxY protein
LCSLRLNINQKRAQRKIFHIFETMSENEISNLIIGSAIDVHTALGPGLLENTYKECLNYKLSKSGLFVEKEKIVPLVFEEVKLESGYRVDLLVEHKVVVELKSVAEITDIHMAQILTYLKLGNFKLGLILNFNVFRLKDGIKRVVNNL